MFSYQILTMYEHGIMKKLYYTYHMELYTRDQFSMSQPQPLGYENVIFTFTCLAFGVAASVSIIIVELILTCTKKQHQEEIEDGGNQEREEEGNHEKYVDKVQIVTDEEAWVALKCLHQFLQHKKISDEGMKHHLRYERLIKYVTDQKFA